MAGSFVPRTTSKPGITAVINGFSKLERERINQGKKTKPKEPPKVPAACRLSKLRVSSLTHTYTLMQAHNKGHNSQNTHTWACFSFVIFKGCVKACCLQEDKGSFYFLFYLQVSVLLDLHWHNLKWNRFKCAVSPSELYFVRVFLFFSPSSHTSEERKCLLWNLVQYFQYYMRCFLSIPSVLPKDCKPSKSFPRTASSPGKRGVNSFLLPWWVGSGWAGERASIPCVLQHPPSTGCCLSPL